MKALSLKQPWASLIEIGAKCIETRGWRTSYVGPIAIHASQRLHGDDVEYALEHEAILLALRAGGYWSLYDLPLGSVVAVGCLAGVERTETARRGRFVTEAELAFGDFSPGRYAWHLRDVVALPEPIPARGQLGLWEWDAPATVLELLATQGAA